MQANMQYDLKRPGFYLVLASVACHIIYSSVIADYFIPGVTRVAFGVQAALISLSIFVSFTRKHYAVSLLSLLYASYVIAQCYLWQYITGQEANVNASLTYLMILSVVVIYESRISIRSVLSIILFFCVIYVILYDLSWKTIANSTVPAAGFLGGGAERTNRAFLAAPLAAFVFFSGIAYAKKNIVFSSFLSSLSIYAFYVAESRQVTAIIFVTMMLSFVSQKEVIRRNIGVAVAVLSLILCSIIMCGFVYAKWNPYEIISWDASGFARYLEYEDAKRVLGYYFLTGVGISPSVDDLQIVVQARRDFFPSDLGIGGVAFLFGIPFSIGLIFLTLVSACLIPSQKARAYPGAMALHWLNQMMALSAYFSVFQLGSSGSMLFGLAILLWNKKGWYEPILGYKKNYKNVHLREGPSM